MIGSSIVSSHEDGLDKLARHARVVLVILAAIQFAGAAFVYIATKVTPWEALISMLVIGGAFAVLALWARKAPLPAVVTGLAIYLAGVIVTGIIDASSVTDGLLMKALIAVMFYNGIAAALTYNNMARMRVETAFAVAPPSPARLRQRRRAGAAK